MLNNLRPEDRLLVVMIVTMCLFIGLFSYVDFQKASYKPIITGYATAEEKTLPQQEPTLRNYSWLYWPALLTAIIISLVFFYNRKHLQHVEAQKPKVAQKSTAPKILHNLVKKTRTEPTAQLKKSKEDLMSKLPSPPVVPSTKLEEFDNTANQVISAAKKGENLVKLSKQLEESFKKLSPEEQEIRLDKLMKTYDKLEKKIK